MKLKIDFSKTVGKIKPLHGMGNSARKAPWDDLLPEFKALKPPFSRLHDTCGGFGGAHYVDVPNIFPNFDADPDDEASYDFTLTDIYIKYLVEAEIEVFYRLGVTIESGPKKYGIIPPSDPHKWASICEHIVRHYNDGWANGYHWNIKYWEIWNEPDGIDPNITAYGPPNWRGTAEQFYELYSIAANHLKKMHPDIKVGGYSACMVRGSFHEGKWTVGLTDFLESFLTYITAPETKAPLDFFSWHTYYGIGEVSNFSLDANFAREILDRYGFNETESYCTEWNAYLSKDRNIAFVYMRNEMGASYYAAAMGEMQICGNVDGAMFYEASLWKAYGPLFHVPGNIPTKAYHAFRFFGELYDLGSYCKVEGGEELYSIGATDGNEGIIMITNIDPGIKAVSLDICGIDAEDIEIYRIDGRWNGEKICETALDMSLPPYSVTLVKINGK